MHLYGCISPEHLFLMGKNNPQIAWERFLPDYAKEFGIKINPETFFSDFADLDKFKKLYLFNHKGLFSQFQAKFNLIIALSHFDDKEIRGIFLPIMKNHLSGGVTFAEYRIMYSPFETDEGYIHKTIAACEGLQHSEETLKQTINGRLSLSLHRRGDFFHKYTILKELMAKNILVNKYLTAIDFCNVEEGNPPKDKIPFFNQVLRDNKDNPSSALAILYHVGESFTDKSRKSATRWVIESAMAGAHRLGHAIALGIPPEILMTATQESVAERIDHLQFELYHYDSISSFGEIEKKAVIEYELSQLKYLAQNKMVPASPTKRYREELRAIQEFGMEIIRQAGAVIESCPTSNLYIGMIDDLAHHPIKRFADKNLKLTIGTDDPGIFNTDIEKEYMLAKETGITEITLEKIRISSFAYTSEKLSGRSV